MSKNPKDINRKDAPVTTFGLTVSGALYSTFGPIPVADVEESNSDSVWAMFEDVPTKAAPLAPPPQDGDPEDPFAPTEMSPLRP
jgi:hypothetical protein